MPIMEDHVVALMKAVHAAEVAFESALAVGARTGCLAEALHQLRGAYKCALGELDTIRRDDLDATWSLRKLQREGWSSGPWDDEPDEAEWVDAATGYRCHAMRNALGSWCGYVMLPRGHAKWDIPKLEFVHTLSVHGGVTWDEFSHPAQRLPNPPAAVNTTGRWIGFDCNHYDDFSPGMQRSRSDHPSAYRTLSYVVFEVTKLAEQLGNRGHDAMRPRYDHPPF